MRQRVEETKNLVRVLIPSSVGAVYTAPEDRRVIVSSILCFNGSGVERNVSLWVGASTDVGRILNRNIPAGTPFVLSQIPIVLNEGEAIYASTSSSGSDVALHLNGSIILDE
jgi:hypothetical protein